MPRPLIIRSRKPYGARSPSEHSAAKTQAQVIPENGRKPVDGVSNPPRRMPVPIFKVPAQFDTICFEHNNIANDRNIDAELRAWRRLDIKAVPRFSAGALERFGVSDMVLSQQCSNTRTQNALIDCEQALGLFVLSQLPSPIVPN